MNPISLYYLSFENIKKYFSQNKGKNESLIFTRAPLLKYIHYRWARDVVFKLSIIAEPFFSLLIVTARLVPWGGKATFTKRQRLSSMLYMVNSPIFVDRVKAAGKYEESIDWMYSIDVDKKHWDVDKRCHSIFEYVSLWNVMWAYVLSIITIIGAQTKLKFRYVFRTFNSFDFFLTYYVLKNIPKETTICFCNQMDRWAILFDNAPQKNKILFQHGIEAPSADWPVKLKYTDTAYVLSMEESELLFKSVFKVKPMNVYLMKPTIELTKMNDDDKFKVLIVGFPGYLMFEKEKAVVNALANENTIVYLKPHPGKEDMTKYINLENEYRQCKIIREKLFPDVDVVVSYRSTLAVEYQLYKKTVLFYSDYSVEKIIERIKELRSQM